MVIQTKKQGLRSILIPARGFWEPGDILQITKEQKLECVCMYRGGSVIPDSESKKYKIKASP